MLNKRRCFYNVVGLIVSMFIVAGVSSYWVLREYSAFFSVAEALVVVAVNNTAQQGLRSSSQLITHENSQSAVGNYSTGRENYSTLNKARSFHREKVNY